MNIKSPRRKEITAFLKMWVNDYIYTWGFDNVIRWFGFEKDTDFFYFYLAWKFMSRRKPKAFSSLATVFYSRYDSRMIVPAYRWKNFLPEIDF